MRFPATISALVLAGGFACTAVAADEPSARRDAAAVAVDPAAAWEAFLSEADLATSYAGFDVLIDVGYSAGAVDAEGCRANVAPLAEATQLLPVSIAVRHAAMSCANEIGEPALAEEELAAVAALARHALDHASHPHAGATIPVLAPVDIYALLRAAGLEYRYEFYEDLRPRRHFPLHVAAWDPEASQERHLRFDFVDAAFALNAGNDEDEFSGFPIQRKHLADQFIKGLLESDDLTAIDHAAIKAAAAVTAPQEKRDALAPAAARGGIQATRAWLALCARKPFPGCAAGLVDAVLPHAEEQNALPMVLLAVAHGEGIGIARDAIAAQSLLAGANARWPGMGGTVAYAELWTEMHDGPLPDHLRRDLEAAWRDGNAEARLLSLRNAAGVEGAVLDPAALADLARPALNARDGQGYAVLAGYHRERDEAATALDWTRRAAEAGNPWEQAMLASHLRFGEPSLPADNAQVRNLLEEAAQGGDAWAARRLAFDSMDAGRWQEAKAWLLDPVARGDIDAILSYAQMLEQDRPGLPGDPAESIRIYRLLSDENDVAAARRRLAELALEGIGMEKDPALAREWLLADAREDDHASQSRLGEALLHGHFGEIEEAEGIRWLEKAIQAEHQEAMLGYGNWLYFTRNTPDSRREARELWQRSHAKDGLMASNNLAWVLCTTPHAEERDVAAGLDVALAMDAKHELASAEVDTVAACHAANGDFRAAAEAQQQAIDDLGSLAVPDTNPDALAEIEATLAGFRERLAMYRGGKAYVELPQ